jgi:hypothetical protein
MFAGDRRQLYTRFKLKISSLSFNPDWKSPKFCGLQEVVWI